MKKPSESTGGRIAALRKARGLTQESFAAACDVSRSAVAQWETDRAGQLRSNISRIAETLGCSVEYLLNGEHGQVQTTGDELAMLRLYRECDADDRSFLLRTARKLAKPPT